MARRTNAFAPQPYEQLASDFRKIGQEDDARMILMAKEDARRARTKMGPVDKIGSWFLKWTIGYGYYPGALPLALCVIFIGSILFGIGYTAEV